MRFYKLLLLVSSILVTIFVWGLFFQQEYFGEWKNIQSKYKDLLVEKAKTPEAKNLAEIYTVRVRQIYLEDLKQIDRCVSCHTGIDNPQMVHEVQPYKTHPGDYLKNHPSTLYGCVICHRGQGRALNKREAHADPGSEAFWETPILPKEYVRSSCGACHDSNHIKEEVTDLVQGKKLSEGLACRGCHMINGVGGSLGPDLNKQGDYAAHHYTMQHLDGEYSTWNWLEKHFLNPQQIVPDSQMKKQELTEEDARDLTTFMLSLQGQQVYGYSRTPQDRYELIANHFGYEALGGEQLFNRMCAACHGSVGTATRGKLNKQYNKYFPTLLSRDFASVVSRNYIIETILKGHQGTMMSGFENGLSRPMVDKLADYIKSFGEEEELAAYEVPGDKEKGGSLFQKVCVDCHGTYGEGAKGPSLRNTVFQQNISDAFIAKTIADGRDGTEMAGLKTVEPEATEQDVANLVAYIRQLPTIAIGSVAGGVGWEKFIDSEKYPGVVTFYQNCSSCHTIGRGDRKGPDLKDVLKRRKREWVYRQIVNPEGLVKSGDKVAKGLAEKFGRVMENPEIPENKVEPLINFLENPDEGNALVAEAMAKAAEQSKGDVDRGRQLYIGELELKNKGPSCLTCHDVPGLSFFGGGNLGVDLLKSKLSAIEIASSLNKVSYKVMKEIYVEKPLDADEINDIVAFIQEARATPRESTNRVWFILLGVVGVVVWFFIIQAFWFKRLKNVRQDLVDRSRR